MSLNNSLRKKNTKMRNSYKRFGESEYNKALLELGINGE